MKGTQARGGSGGYIYTYKGHRPKAVRSCIEIVYVY